MKKIWLFLAIPLATGGLATLLSGGMGAYSQFSQPPLSPPGWVFPLVWTILYLAMGYASWRVYTKEENVRQRWGGLGLYGFQLLLNFLWPIVFFRYEAFLAAFVVLILLWIMIAVTMWQFYRSDERAGDLMIPYLLWVTFAGYLNLGVYLLNR